MTTELKVGDPAPDFHMPGDDGPISLNDFRGKSIVLYFYPKDDTSGCTAEALDFTAKADDFGDVDAVVIGVSKDTTASHGKFRAKYDLTPKLGSDKDGDVIERYGVWVEKNMYGRKYMGIERATFLIDSKGLIQKIWRKVKVPGHAAEVLESARRLK
jgi:peroxiredoxin Q/BCP